MVGVWFWGAVGALCLAVAGTLLRALKSPADGANVNPAQAVYRDQLAEIERDLARKVIAPQDAAQLRLEVSRRLLNVAQIGGQSAPADPIGAHSHKIIIATICATITGALALYIGLGAPEYADLPLRKRLAMAQAAYEGRPSQAAAARPDVQQPSDADLLALITQLRSAVAARPTDVQGLTLLARNEAALGNYNAATKAYLQLIAAKGGRGTAEDHLGAASAMIAATGGLVTPQAEAQLTAALNLDPQNGMAQYFSGMMFAQIGRPDRTFALWEPLLRAKNAQAPWAGPIRDLLPQVAEAAGIKYQLPEAAANPSEGDIAAAADMSAQDRQGMIETMVAGLESRLLEQGGTRAEWLRLITSLGVLRASERQKTALAAGLAAMEGDADAQRALREAAQ